MHLILGFIFLILPMSVYGAESFTVHVSIGKVSEVIFPNNITNVVKGGQPDAVLIEAMDNTLFILPKKEDLPDLVISTDSKETYPLSLKLSKEHDIKLQIANDSRISGVNEHHDLVMDIMQTLLQGGIPTQAAVIDIRKSISFEQSKIRFNVDVVYDLNNVIVYILTAHNLSMDGACVPIQEISFENLLAVASESDFLRPAGIEGDSTKIYMIIGK